MCWHLPFKIDKLSDFLQGHISFSRILFSEGNMKVFLYSNEVKNCDLEHISFNLLCMFNFNPSSQIPKTVKCASKTNESTIQYNPKLYSSQ